MTTTYTPRGKNKAILDVARSHIESVSYPVTLRWCFYRLLQQGYYSSKSDYKSKWQPLASSARRNHYQDWWIPSTFVDDGRSIIITASGQATASEAIQAAKDRARRYSYVDLDHFFHQKATIVWMFEAQGMVGQFRKYAPECDLIPLSGDPSFPLKQDIANHLSLLVERYSRPVTVLYAGDYDAGGLRIPKTTMLDVAEWSDCPYDIRFQRVGIIPEQADKYGVHQAPDGTIQWEALSDDAAGRLITSAMGRFIDCGLISRMYNASEKVTSALASRLCWLART